MELGLRELLIELELQCLIGIKALLGQLQLPLELAFVQRLQHPMINRFIKLRGK